MYQNIPELHIIAHRGTTPHLVNTPCISSEVQKLTCRWRRLASSLMSILSGEIILLWVRVLNIIMIAELCNKSSNSIWKDTQRSVKRRSWFTKEKTGQMKWDSVTLRLSVASLLARYCSHSFSRPSCACDDEDEGIPQHDNGSQDCDFPPFSLLGSRSKYSPPKLERQNECADSNHNRVVRWDSGDVWSHSHYTIVSFFSSSSEHHSHHPDSCRPSEKCFSKSDSLSTIRRLMLSFFISVNVIMAWWQQKKASPHSLQSGGGSDVFCRLLCVSQSPCQSPASTGKIHHNILCLHTDTLQLHPNTL